MPWSRFRLLAIIAAVGVALAMLGGSAPPAEAAAKTACADASCPDPTGWAAERWKPHAGYPSHGGTRDGMNCTNYAAWRVIQNGVAADSLRGLGNAGTWASRAATKGFTVNRTPAVGAIAQWRSNHVAYVEQVNANGTIVISESNTWLGQPSNRAWLRHRTISASAVDAFIHFRNAPQLTLLAPGDLDGDRAPDLLVMRPDGVVKSFKGDGSGGFRTGSGSRSAVGWHTYAHVITPGDFSGDSRPDVLAITVSGKVLLFRGTGRGWSPGTQIGTGFTAMRSAFSAGDFTGDGRADLLTVGTDGRLRVYPGDGRGGWGGAARIVAEGFSGAKLVTSVGDLSGDGKPDILALWPDGALQLYAGAGDGTLSDPDSVVLATGWTTVTSIAGRGDVTGDGFADLYVLRSGVVELWTGDGEGGLRAPKVPLGVTW